MGKMGKWVKSLESRKVVARACVCLCGVCVIMLLVLF